MASRQATIDFLLEQISGAGQVHARKMFGEYAIYRETKVVALVCDDQLFVKPTAAGRALIEAPEEASPYPGAKPHFLIAGDLWDDREWMARLIRATADALPMPKPKRPRQTVTETARSAHPPRRSAHRNKSAD